MKIKIDAIDTLFFKDGKPFSMGEETWADGIFPPPPSVIYGAISSSMLSNNPELFNKLGREFDFDDLKITNIFYRIKNTSYYPLPLDFVYRKNKTAREINDEKYDRKYKVSLLKREFSHSLSSLNREIKIVTADEEVETLSNAMISESDLNNYLSGYIDDEIKCLILDDYFLTESKVGIGRNDVTHTTEESKLYRVGMRRPTDFSIFVELDDNENIKELTKFIKLGAEGKVARISNPDLSNYLNDISGIDNGKFKLYLQTPSFFEKGWLPSWIDKKTMKGKIDNLELELLTAYVGKPISIGGFDMLNKKPKAMRKAVPAGSVYYFKILSGDFEQAKNLLNNRSISEFDSEKYGYGKTLIGVYNE
ncbi:MAG: type III-B CRISPR module-associated protein Cmr3 [Melioribacteraceae bacterium]|nr:type III-B CRISPR module-associated protein Cmr3 [Melioribacteraceae bacterium]